MNRVGRNGLILIASLWLHAACHAHGPRVGDTYVLAIEHHEKHRAGDSSSGSSNGRDTLIERIVAIAPEGVTLEYSEPDDGRTRQTDWHFPALIFRAVNGERSLINRDELDARLGPWLDTAQLSPEDCGRWIFTWNAFKIDCDPASVVETTQAFDMWSFDFEPGASWSEKGGLEAVLLQPVNRDSTTLGAVVALDPDQVRLTEAKTDTIVGQITGKPTTLEAALQAHKNDEIEGAIRVTIESNSPPIIDRLTRTTEMTVRQPGKEPEERCSEAVITRTRLDQ